MLILAAGRHGGLLFRRNVTYHIGGNAMTTNTQENAQETMSPLERQLHDLVFRFVALREEQDQLEARQGQVKSELEDVSAALIVRFAVMGMRAYPLADGGTVGLTTQTWAYAKKEAGTEGVVKVLRELDMADMIRTKTDYSTATMSAYVREEARNKRDLDPRLAAVLDIREEKKVVLRRK
jgi:hypothetical protein